MGNSAGSTKGKDILVRKAPLSLHFKIDQYMEDSGLRKREAVLELIEEGARAKKVRVPKVIN